MLFAHVIAYKVAAKNVHLDYIELSLICHVNPLILPPSFILKWEKYEKEEEDEVKWSKEERVRETFILCKALKSFKGFFFISSCAPLKCNKIVDTRMRW